MKKRISAALGLLLLFAQLSGAAWAEELLVGGQAVGIEISADGVIVSGFCEVQTENGPVSPAQDAGFAVSREPFPRACEHIYYLETLLSGAFQASPESSHDRAYRRH